ncbi:hypothetical protein IB260_00510 [Pseudomonas sp. PDM23]|uniref:hypothetical protein n=1 Tax=Pseudomonas sp. PDM23 TaxID=2769275 RepID=UPI00177EF1C2|nr:hypothetical protein [Pseudomonas sp. PDM23]MBD9573776.1 hypothetical protein [Pseudomonas sp. PDM23]
MNTHEFLRKQIDQAIQKEGFSQAIAFAVADEALEFYKRTASFKSGAIGECLAYAKKRAKEMQKLSGTRKAS